MVKVRQCKQVGSTIEEMVLGSNLHYLRAVHGSGSVPPLWLKRMIPHVYSP